MTRLPGILKVTVVFMIDFFVIYAFFHDISIAFVVMGIIVLYVCLGGYLALFKEGAVRVEKLPNYERSYLESAKWKLVEAVKNTSSVDISKLKLYLIADDNDMQATAYGANCVSVSKGTLGNADPLTLNAVLAHEISHILNFDAEFNRAVFATIFLICGAISIASFVSMIIIWLIFLVCSLFNSWLGVMTFKGISKVIRNIFMIIQKSIVIMYRSIISFLSRAAEFRSDRYSAQLGYAIQLAHFLTYAAPESHRQLTFTEALYRTHPPTPKRVMRLEAFASSETQI